MDGVWRSESTYILAWTMRTGSRERCRRLREKEMPALGGIDMFRPADCNP